jgi:hypothetical protein
VNNNNADIILLRAISGSKAYGLDTPQSDTDIRGVFAVSVRKLYSLAYAEQWNEENNNIVMYEVRKFTELCLKNNPTMLELLATPEDCILEYHPAFRRFTPDIFLSKLCRETFAGYAHSQVRKARGLNKKIVNPMGEQRKTVIDFCYILQGHGSVALSSYLSEKGWKQEQCGLVNISHARDLYALYYSPDIRFSGIIRGEDSNDVALSSVPEEFAVSAYLSFNKDGYSRYCKDWKEYQQWIELRNEERYRGTIEHGKNYDAKNMMHVFRLLDMALEIAIEGKIIVRRSNRRELLAIRAGTYGYESLLSRAEEKLVQIYEAFEQSPLPDAPDAQHIENLLIETRESVYQN